MNSTKYKDGDEYIINALITYSQNTFSGEMGFKIQPHHMKFMRELWDEHIETQKDDSIILKLREKELRETFTSSIEMVGQFHLPALIK